MSNEQKSVDASKWHLVQRFKEYVDYDKVLASFPDQGRTTVDTKLVFNTNTRLVFMSIHRTNDLKDPESIGPAVPVTWSAALDMLRDDGAEIPDELSLRSYMVPCFLVVRARGESLALGQVSRVQTAVRNHTDTHLYIDEVLNLKEVPAGDEYHTMLDYYTTEELIR